MKLIINRFANVCRDFFQNTFFNNSRSLQLLGPSIFSNSPSSKSSIDTSVFEHILLMAAPKSKVSPGKKRMKHKRYEVDQLNWIECKRCGESKLPHRMCTKNKEICVMREDDYEIYLKNKAVDEAAANKDNTSA